MRKRIRGIVAGLAITTAAITSGLSIQDIVAAPQADTTWGAPDTTNDTTWGTPPADQPSTGGTVTPQDTTWG